MWLWTSWEGFWRDRRFAARTLRKNRGFTFVAAVSLALGIGENTAMFSLVDGVWTRPMAVSRPDEIVRVFSVTNQNPEDAFSYPEYLELQGQAPAFNGAFNGLIARGGRGAQMPNSDGTADLRSVNVVTLNFFSVLGVRPLAGRLFTPQDEPLLKQQPAVVLGNSFWQQRFGGDPSIIGKSIELQR